MYIETAKKYSKKFVQKTSFNIPTLREEVGRGCNGQA